MSVTPSWARHVSVGSSLTQAEYEQSSGHEFDYALVRSANFVVSSSGAAASGTAQSDYQCAGTTDGGTIQAAITALPDTGGRIILTSGTFTITQPIVFSGSSDDNTIIEGQGPSTVITLGSAANCNIFYGSVSTNNVCIRNLKIIGNSAQNTSGNGISGLFTNSVFENLYITDCPENGIQVGNGSTSVDTYNRISKCILVSNIKRGCELSYCSSNNKIDNCIFNTNTLSGLLIESNYNTISGCNFSNNSGHGVFAGSLRYINYNTINGCLFYRNTMNGLYIANEFMNNIIDSNVFSMNNIGLTTYSSICGSVKGVEDFSQNIISNNILDGASSAAYNIHITAGSTHYIGNSFTNNIMTGAGSANVYQSNNGSVNIWVNNYPDSVNTTSDIVSGTLTPGNANSFAFSWQNPRTASIFVEPTIDITTAGTISGAVMDVGSASAGTITANDSIDGLPIDQVISYTGAPVKLGSGSYLTGQILTQHATSLAGKYYMRYWMV